MRWSTCGQDMVRVRHREHPHPGSHCITLAPRRDRAGTAGCILDRSFIGKIFLIRAIPIESERLLVRVQTDQGAERIGMASK